MSHFLPFPKRETPISLTFFTCPLPPPPLCFFLQTSMVWKYIHFPPCFHPNLLLHSLVIKVIMCIHTPLGDMLTLMMNDANIYEILTYMFVYILFGFRWHEVFFFWYLTTQIKYLFCVFIQVTWRKSFIVT